MTDRVKGLVVALETDIREDDVQVLVNAIKMLRGVLAVETKVADMDDWVNRSRIQSELRAKLFEVLR